MKLPRPLICYYLPLLWVLSVASIAVKAADTPPAQAITPTYSATTTINASLTRVLLAMGDQQEIATWIPFCTRATVLSEKTTPNNKEKLWLHLFFVGLLGLPPQDAVVSIQASQSGDHKTVTLSVENDKSRIPPEPGMQRVAKLNATFTLLEMAHGDTQVAVNMQVEPAFPVPTVVAGLRALLPQQILARLTQRVADPRYADTGKLLHNQDYSSLYRGFVL